jgi:arginine decarboxylase
LISQTFDFPQEGFEVIDSELHYHGVPLMQVIKQYGTPLRITYLPKIGQQIQKAKKLFNVAMAKVDYKGNYTYCYCTKSSHFSFILEEVLKHDVNLETSSTFDIEIIRELYNQGELKQNKYIVCNGFKTTAYKENISQLINEGFTNVIPVLDNKNELQEYLNLVEKEKINVGIRIASEEEPNFEFYTSRLGIRYKDIKDYYMKEIHDNPKVDLKMLHFFINKGMKDSIFYWSELSKCLSVYVELKKICPSLDSLNIGGGLPIKNSLNFDFDYEYIIEEIVGQIKIYCNQHGVDEPNIFTEFGSYTVGESGIMLFNVLEQKQQNDTEMWNMIDGSFITTMPDTWGINQRFIMMAINKWDKEYQRVNLGGLTCDGLDYYNSEAHVNAVFLPKFVPEEPLYIGFFNTGAYQESLSGYGGTKHCLIPSPKHILIDVNEEGEYYTRLFAKEQSYKSMLKILGY